MILKILRGKSLHNNYIIHISNLKSFKDHTSYDPSYIRFILKHKRPSMMIYLSIIKLLISRCNRIGRRRRHRIDYGGTWHLEARNTRQRSWHVFLGEISVFLYPLQRRPELGIRLEEPFDKILPVSTRYRIVNLPIMIVTYPRVRFFQRCCVERWLPYQQGVQYAPERPNIRLVTVCLLIQHFRRDVIRCSAYRPAHTNELLQFSRVSSAKLFLILETRFPF